MKLIIVGAGEGLQTADLIHMFSEPERGETGQETSDALHLEMSSQGPTCLENLCKQPVLENVKNSM